MIELELTTDLVNPVVFAAFEGWNDAAEAATGAVDHLWREWGARVIGELDPEDYYDFQVNRPVVSMDPNGHRHLTWPTTQIALCSPPGMDRDVILIRGVEPSMRWKQYVGELLAVVTELGAELVVTLGGLLADSPHTRPIPVEGTTTEPDLMDRLGLDVPTYEGPTGIIGVFLDACMRYDIPSASFWAAVPHYVASPPAPKATLAIIQKIEELLDHSVPLGELPEDAQAWERGVDDLASDDEEIAEYVKSLEESRDTAELPEASGDAIAKEFEKYLRRRDNDR